MEYLEPSYCRSYRLAYSSSCCLINQQYSRSHSGKVVTDLSENKRVPSHKNSITDRPTKRHKSMSKINARTYPRTSRAHSRWLHSRCRIVKTTIVQPLQSSVQNRHQILVCLAATLGVETKMQTRLEAKARKLKHKPNKSTTLDKGLKHEPNKLT